MSERVHVDVPRGYDVVVGVDLLRDLPRQFAHRRIALMSDANVAPHHATTLREAYERAGSDVVEIVVAPGEQSKSVETWHEALTTLAMHAFSRDDGVIALGGGVVGDLAGFVAASYARGLPFAQVPTSLLAMADAAIGGKTGINLPEGKNLVGAFWQPSIVVMDMTTLATLPPTLFEHGLVEMVKHGLLADPGLIDPLLDPTLGPTSDPTTLERLVAASARVKAHVVALDEREEGDARAMLNLGHTVAHALEAFTQHGLSHGEAVAWGLVYAAELSILHPNPLVTADEREDWRPVARRLLDRIMPTVPPATAWETLLPYLSRDKKVRGGTRRWVLADAPGAPWVAGDVTTDEEVAAWNAFLDVRASWLADHPKRATLAPEAT